MEGAIVKHTLKALSAVAVLAAAALPLTANAVLIDGIEVGTGGNFHFVASTIMEQKVGGGIITAVGDQLEGVGLVTQIFDGATLVWSALPGQELTFSFGGYTANNVAANHITFTGGSVSFFHDLAADADFGTGAGFTDGSNWLTLAGTSFLDTVTGTNATLVSDGTLLGASISGTGIGLLSVTGGLAGGFFDTNGITAIGTGNIADFEINSSFNNQTSPFLFGTHGTANISQPAVSVPEPASLALVALGLLGIAGSSRKSKKK